MKKDIEAFLKRFHEHESVDDTFTNGCCYWFAAILLSRFWKEGAVLMYDQISNHFGTMIYGEVYDITGNVTDDYSWERWADINDSVLKARIKRDCIMF